VEKKDDIPLGNQRLESWFELRYLNRFGLSEYELSSRSLTVFRVPNIELIRFIMFIGCFVAAGATIRLCSIRESSIDRPM
jgi:hypothetical protein